MIEIWIETDGCNTRLCTGMAQSHADQIARVLLGLNVVKSVTCLYRPIHADDRRWVVWCQANGSEVERA